MRFARWLWHDWPMLFAYGVAIYFAVAALVIAVDVPSVPSFRSGEGAAGSATTSTTSDPVTAGTLEFRVAAFRVVPDRKNPGQFDARVTLEVENNGSGNADVHPSRLMVRNARGETAAAEDLGLEKVTISPHLAQTVPVSFSIDPVPGASYTVLYAGQSIFSGRPF